MPVFTFRGTNRSGATVTGEQTAVSKTELVNTLRRQQINVTKMSEKGKEFNLPTFGGGVDAKELAVFTRQFSVMIDAGLPLVQCLEILANQQENKVFQKVLTGTRAAVEGGSTLSASMRQFEKVFDPLYVNLVEAGETGGILDTILQRLSSYIEKNVKLKRATVEIRSSCLPDRRASGCRSRHYSVAVESCPDFRDAICRPRGEPAAAHAYRNRPEQLYREHIRALDLRGVYRRRDRVEGLVWNSRGPHGHRPAAVETAVDRNFAPENCRGPVHAHPGNADFKRRPHPGRFGQKMYTARTAGNAVIEKALLQVRKALEAGPELLGSFKRIRRISGHGNADDRRRRTDRRDGRLLQKIADFYEDEVDAAVKDLLSAMEPMMIVFLGLVVGGIVISMYLPLFSLIGQLSSAH